MKKILIVTDNLLTQINGVTTTFKNIENHAFNDGYTIEYLSPELFPHIPAPRYPEVKLSLPHNIKKYIKNINPDYIHIATEGPLGLAARNYCNKHKIKYNTSYHTKFPDFIKKIYFVPKGITYGYLRWFHKKSSVVLTTTDAMVNDLSKHKFRNNLATWTRGVNRETLHPSIEYTHTNKTPIVLYVGRVSKEKNLQALCKLENLYDIRIVGDGPARIKLEKKYRKVKFLGYKTGVDLANCYAEADVFCFPSKADTFGIVMIEAMSMGTPVAAYPVTGPLEVIESGVTGYMSNNLSSSIVDCLLLDRKTIIERANKWTWSESWDVFKNNLVSK